MATRILWTVCVLLIVTATLVAVRGDSEEDVAIESASAAKTIADGLEEDSEEVADDIAVEKDDDELKFDDLEFGDDQKISDREKFEREQAKAEKEEKEEKEALGRRDSGLDDCIEALFVQAGVTQELIPRYVQAFRNNEFDEEALYKLSFLEMVNLLQSKEFGFKHAGDLFRLHTCVTGRGPCVLKPFCQNSGKCVHVSIVRQHVCQCPDQFQGQRCEKEVKDRISQIEDGLLSLQSQVRSSGVSYTRWAKTTCNESTGASLVYSGFMAGSYYTHHGGAAEYLCLPSDPEYDSFRPGTNRAGLLYIAEFETSATFSPYAGFHDHNPLCAVCHSGGGRSSQIMIPAKRTCPEAWTMEYRGYLMTAHHGHKRTQHICIDGDPEVQKDSAKGENGALLYFVEAVCTNEFKCPPYDKQKELTCVVCTR